MAEVSVGLPIDGDVPDDDNHNDADGDEDDAKEVGECLMPMYGAGMFALFVALFLCAFCYINLEKLAGETGKKPFPGHAGALSSSFCLFLN